MPANSQTMTLEDYFKSLIDRLQTTEEITNAGKDAGGFFEPTHAVLLQRLNILKDLHGKPAAKGMVRSSWQYVTEHMPPEWLIMDASVKTQIKKMLAD